MKAEALHPIIIHSLEDAEAACAAAAALSLPLTLVSGPGAGLYAGPAWFKHVTGHAQAAYPDVDLTAVLDCADQAGTALAALSAGLKHIAFAAHPEAGERLRSIAAEKGAVIHDRLPPALDLRGERNAIEACRRWLKTGAGSVPTLQRRGASGIQIPGESAESDNSHDGHQSGQRQWHGTRKADPV